MTDWVEARKLERNIENALERGFTAEILRAFSDALIAILKHLAEQDTGGGDD